MTTPNTSPSSIAALRRADDESARCLPGTRGKPLSKGGFRAAIANLRSLALLLAVLSLPTSAVQGTDICEGDEIWLISTRGITSVTCRADLDSPQLSTYQYHGCDGFSPSDSSELLAQMLSGDEKSNVIYVHGNRFPFQESINRGLFVYRQIVRQRCRPGPMRFVIWSWPSDPIDGVFKDVRLKAQRTDAQGLYLAWFLRQLQTGAQDLTLIGYSFGGRVVTGALHATAGGSLGGRCLAGDAVVGMNIRVGLVAAAVNRSWLSAGCYHGLATKNMNCLTTMYNPRDCILKRYWILEPGSRAEALGTTVPLAVGPRADGTRLPVRSHNCSSSVGKHHDEIDYFSQQCKAGAILARLVACPCES